jgi:hypothetical protein
MMHTQLAHITERHRWTVWVSLYRRHIKWIYRAAMLLDVRPHWRGGTVRNQATMAFKSSSVMFA